MAKMLDFITDKRVFPLALVSLMFDNVINPLSKKQNDPSTHIDIMLTVDVENTVTNDIHVINQQIKKIAEFFDEQKILGTFFIQGSIISGLAQQLQSLSRKDHEIGLHGHTHDNWGDKKWFLDDKVLNESEKKQGLKLALAKFSEYKLPAPKSFRAPNLSVNKETLLLLRQMDFTIDSSYPSYLGGGANKITKQNGLWSIPVSSLSISEINFKGFLPFLSYEMLTLENIIKWDQQKSKKYVEQIIFNQKKHGIKPSLIILCHNWEFDPTTKFSYASDANLAKLRQFLIWIQEIHKCNLLTISQYVRNL